MQNSQFKDTLLNNMHDSKCLHSETEHKKHYKESERICCLYINLTLVVENRDATSASIGVLQ